MCLSRVFQQCVVLIALILPVQLWAGIYVYEDENGVRHYTNAPTDKRYKPATFDRVITPRPFASNNGFVNSRRKPSGSCDPAQYDRHIARAANTHMVDPLLIKAIIRAESDFDQFATSSKGAQGLMQLMPETARDLRVTNPYNAAQNINGGTRYFKKLLDAYGGDLARSLAAYNAGPGRVTRDGPFPKIKETVQYVQRVTRYYRMYQQSRLDKLVTVN